VQRTRLTSSATRRCTSFPAAVPPSLRPIRLVSPSRTYDFSLRNNSLLSPLHISLPNSSPVQIIHMMLSKQVILLFYFLLMKCADLLLTT
jgi:hypothetical protein